MTNPKGVRITARLFIGGWNSLYRSTLDFKSQELQKTAGSEQLDRIGVVKK